MIDPNLFTDIESFLKNPPEGEKPGILEEWEIQGLIVSFASSRGDEGFSEDDLMHIIRWAERIRLEESMLNLILDGSCNVNYIDSDVTIKITELGKERNQAAIDG